MSNGDKNPADYDLDSTTAYRMGVAAERMRGPPVEVSSRDLKEIIRLLSVQNRLLLEQNKTLKDILQRSRISR